MQFILWQRKVLQNPVINKPVDGNLTYIILTHILIATTGLSIEEKNTFFFSEPETLNSFPIEK